MKGQKKKKNTHTHPHKHTNTNKPKIQNQYSHFYFCFKSFFQIPREQIRLRFCKMPPQLHPPSPSANLRRLDSKIWWACPSEPSRSQNDFAATSEDKILSFTKILMLSNANNGGRFFVLRFCADSIFPPLNYQAKPPMQTLSVTDVHGMVCLWVSELRRLMEKKAKLVCFVVERVRWREREREFEISGRECRRFF